MPSTIKKTFLSSNALREMFLNYFRDAQHEVVPSSSLIPHNDPTLLFTNAGMVQFKDVFLGKETRSFKRAASSQRCVRAGGKHNDLERVGYTARHHTFFEMLGNFSFGDYFKRDAIKFAWRFLTDVLKLPKEKLWVTVFKEDEEAENIWLNELKIDPSRFSRCGEESNFWSMGQTGPCGPCTEIFYDHGDHIPGGPPGSPDEDGDRYVEIWNLVFMQYDRCLDGVLTLLPKPSVDTGMGLERIAAVMQGVTNNYDIDLFQHLIRFIATLANTEDLTHTSLRVIADHIRSCAFLIMDGVTPHNEGRGYVLRRIIRRALRHGNQLGFTEPFFYKIVSPLIEEMGEAYPELKRKKAHIEKVLHQEEKQFGLTLTNGIKVFEEAIQHLKERIIPGEIVFKLYDTYGFPADLTADIARERHLSIDLEGFETLMTAQKNRAREAHKFTADYHLGAHLENPTEFIGYKDLTEEDSPDTASIIALYHNQQSVDSLSQGLKGSIILDRTPFYAESGGQVGDQGFLKNGDSIFRVEDTQKQGQAFIHIGFSEKGQFKLGDMVETYVDLKRRAAAVLNHTATHLLHRVLRKELGEEVQQKGSLVHPERLRFDFSYPSALTQDQINLIEKKVNEEIRKNHEAIVKHTDMEGALKEGAIALFEEKYGDEVRVVRFGESVELCGGTHAHHTGNIGLFKIIGETGIAAGIRRIEAVTGEKALEWISLKEAELRLKLKENEEKIHHLEKNLSQLQQKLHQKLAEELLHSAKPLHDTQLLVAIVKSTDTKSLRETVDQLKNKLGSAIIVLATQNENKIHLIVGVTKDQISRIKAGDLVNMIALQIGGKGGGRPDLAEAGGNQPENLTKALNSVYDWVENRMGGMETHQKS